MEQDREQGAHAAASHAPETIHHYKILEKLGEGGMGVVYAAEDQRLGRRVALKLLRTASKDPNARSRLIREARLAAGFTHPLICQVFELGEWEGQPFIAMELLNGKPLTARLGAPIPASEALRIAVSVIDALRVLHEHNIVHRDLKPSNIFVTGESIKVLDFGLARSSDLAGVTDVGITQEGVFVGTPQYAAPEQLLGAPVDARADLFSAGVILYEMLAGRPPFSGQTMPAVVHSVLYDTPPVLTGSASIALMDRILHRILAKRPEDRYPTAAAIADDLRHALSLAGGDRLAEARPIFRLAVLPFRLLKPDPDIDYLPMSFADALVSSLNGFESLVVRSTMKSGRYANTIPDLNALATDLAVDVVLTGSILQMNDRLRVTTELVSVPAGDVWWTQTTQVAPDQIFELNDQLAQKLIQSLPLTARDQAPKAPVPSVNAKAYELYLRGMQLRMEPSSWRQARSLFDRCLALDPGFAPAWAELGRVDRILGKYEDPAQLARAETAFLHALQLDPKHGAAQHYYAQLEVDLGRVGAALSRLLKRAEERRAEPYIYAALVHALRYGGLLEESVAAHLQAVRLDPTVSTSVLHTYYMQGEYVRALEDVHRSSDPFEARLLGAMGRDTEAIHAARREEERFAAFPVLRSFSSGLRAAFEGQRDEALAALQYFDSFTFNDGEGLFYVAEIYAKLGIPESAYRMLERSVAAGFWCLPAFERDPYLQPLREDTRWRELLNRVKSRQQSIKEEFMAARGRTTIGF
jgi:serine/threonine protein kinase/tetratricopeptide (TPR) repeat protein